MGKVPFIDTTGEANLAELVKQLQAIGGKLLISGIEPQPLELLKRTGLYETIGAQQFYAHTGDAIDTALSMIQTGRCAGCRHAAFRECAALSGIQETAGRASLKGHKPAIAGKLSGGI
ncbi:STAS domain protein [compost metagenome]